MNRRTMILVLLAATATTVVAAMEDKDVPPPKLPPCLTEDSDNCYWDAKSRGNGKGRSFYVIDGHVIYLKDKRDV